MKTVTIASGKLQPEAIVAIAAIGELLYVDMPIDFDLLAIISPAELAETIPESDFRKQILYVMGMLALIDGIPPQPQIKVLEEFASALGEDCNLIQQIRSLSSGGMPLLLYRFTYLRNTFLNSPIYAQIKRSGVFNTVNSLATTWGLVEDKYLAERYATLATYPEGSLGLALHRYYLANEFAMPGQKRSLPAEITSHDVSHLLSGYDIDYVGETLVAAFTAGYRYTESTFFSFLSIELMSLTTMMPSPSSPSSRMSIFSQPEMAKRFVRAFERGLKCKVNLFEDFDLWTVAHESIPTLCDRWGIEPE
jgi:hypothetical protein